MRDVRLPRYLRRNLTDAERRLWSRLRRHGLGAHFRRQHPIGPYVVDFVCLEANLVIEVDGGQHIDSSRDDRRDSALTAAGFTVLRFWNNDVLQNLEGVCQRIAQAICLPTPPP